MCLYEARTFITRSDQVTSVYTKHVVFECGDFKRTIDFFIGGDAEEDAVDGDVVDAEFEEVREDDKR